MLRRLADRAFEHPLVYRTLQAPFHERKLAPVLRRLHGHPEMRVLDVGCGPGTNAAHFRAMHYTGVDINPDYIASAQRRVPGRFLAPGGAIHGQGLVHPEHVSPARVLPLLARGGHARPIAQPNAPFERATHIAPFEQYPLGLPGIPLWHMAYLAGRSR